MRLNLILSNDRDNLKNRYPFFDLTVYITHRVQIESFVSKKFNRHWFKISSALYQSYMHHYYNLMVATTKKIRDEINDTNTI